MAFSDQRYLVGAILLRGRVTRGRNELTNDITNLQHNIVAMLVDLDIKTENLKSSTIARVKSIFHFLVVPFRFCMFLLDHWPVFGSQRTFSIFSKITVVCERFVCKILRNLNLN